MNENNFFHELKRRNVPKAAVTYIAVVWVVLQAASIILPALEAPENSMRYILIGLIVLFPIWLLFAWIYEYTPHGFRKTDDVPLETSVVERTGKRMTNVIVISLSLAVILLLTDRFYGITESILRPDKQKSLAVLPIANHSPNNENAYISNGIMHEITGRISILEDLNVIAKQSVLKYENSKLSISEISKELGVDYILEGGVQTIDNRIRINMSLIDSDSEEILWNHEYDGTLIQIFEFQSEIANNVLDRLGKTLNSLQKTIIDRQPTGNMQAYQQYLNGLELENLISRNLKERSNETEEATRSFYKNAITLDPAFAEAYVGLARCFSFDNYDNADSSIYFANKALELNNNLAEAYAIKGDVQQLFGEEEGHENMLKAYSLNPNSTRINLFLANSYSRKAQFDLAFKFYQHAKQNSPFDVKSYYSMAQMAYRLGMIEETYQIIGEAQKRFPSAPMVNRVLGFADWVLKNDPTKIIAENEELLDSESDLILRTVKSQLGDYYNTQYEWNSSKKIFESLSTSSTGELEFPPERLRYIVSYAFALKQLGEHQKADQLVENILNRKYHGLKEGDKFYQSNLIALSLAYAYQGQADSCIYWVKEWKRNGSFILGWFENTSLIDSIRHHATVQEFILHEQAKNDSMAANIRRIDIKG